MGPTKQNSDRKTKRKSDVDINTLVYGKLPPQAKSVEEAILGAITLEKSAIDVVSEILKPECFYVETHQMIFKAMQELSRANKPVDLITVIEQLSKNEHLELCGGAYYVTALQNSVVSSANIEAHCRIVFEKFLQREMIRISGQIINDAYEDTCDALDLIDDWEEQMTKISTKRILKKSLPYDALLVQRIQRIEDLRHKKSHITGIPSGFGDIDRITHGWQNTDLIVLAARPSVGKTAFALQLARNAAAENFVAFFSLEMSAGQLVDRNLASESEIWLDKITNGDLDDEGMKQLYKRGVQPLSRAMLHIDDTPGVNVFEVRAACRKLKRKNNLGLVVIDYLQLMSGTGERRNENREQEVSKISRNLKALAKELEVPIIALSQLSRKTEERKGEKTPLLSDLRESGAIEQDADMVMFMYRPEYYDDSVNEIGESREGETHIMISKHRNGKLAKGKGVIKLRANLNIQKFFEWDHLAAPQPELGAGAWRPVREDERTDDLP